MGHWSMHIEGAGVHDNGRDDDAEVMLQEFAAKLAAHHAVQSVTFIVGSARELPASDTGRVEAPNEWRHRAH
jgi:hypothetical protein